MTLNEILFPPNLQLKLNYLRSKEDYAKRLNIYRLIFDIDNYTNMSLFRQAPCLLVKTGGYNLFNYIGISNSNIIYNITTKLAYTLIL